LSYQAKTLMRVPSTTAVEERSTIAEWEVPLKSDETSFVLALMSRPGRPIGVEQRAAAQRVGQRGPAPALAAHAHRRPPFGAVAAHCPPSTASVSCKSPSAQRPQ